MPSFCIQAFLRAFSFVFKSSLYFTVVFSFLSPVPSFSLLFSVPSIHLSYVRSFLFFFLFFKQFVISFLYIFAPAVLICAFYSVSFFYSYIPPTVFLSSSSDFKFSTYSLPRSFFSFCVFPPFLSIILLSFN